jgi:hypothetical protein
MEKRDSEGKRKLGHGHQGSTPEIKCMFCDLYKLEIAQFLLSINGSNWCH